MAAPKVLTVEEIRDRNDAGDRKIANDKREEPEVRAAARLRLEKSLDLRASEVLSGFNAAGAANFSDDEIAREMVTFYESMTDVVTE